MSYIFYMTPALVGIPTPGLKLHCQNMKKKTSKETATPRIPPWFSNATGSRDNLYVWPEGANTQRLGNRLFNYASTFGIAWRNRRVPILPHTGKTNPQYDLANFFTIRMPVDEGNQIIQVDSGNVFSLYIRGFMYVIAHRASVAHRPSVCPRVRLSHASDLLEIHRNV